MYQFSSSFPFYWLLPIPFFCTFSFLILHSFALLSTFHQTGVPSISPPHVYSWLVTSSVNASAFCNIHIWLNLQNYIPELMREDIPQALRGQRNVVFGNIEKIYEFHSGYFLRALEAYEMRPFAIGSIFLRYVSPCVSMFYCLTNKFIQLLFVWFLDSCVN